MKYSIVTSFVLLFCGISLLTSCCEVDDHSDCDEVLFVSFIDNLRDSLEANPRAVLDIYIKEREKTTDSVSSYALLNAISQCYFWAGDIDSSMMILKKVMTFCERAQPSPCLLLLEVNSYFRYGVRLAYIHQDDDAAAYYRKAHNLLIKSEKRSGLPNIYLVLANCHNRKSDYVTASYYYQRALFVADSLNLGNRIRFQINFSLADLYSMIDNFDMAEYYFGQAEKYVNEFDEGTQSYYYDTKGYYYLKIKDYPRALNCFYFDYNYVTSYSYPNHEERAQASANIADTYLRMGQVDSARYFLDRAKEYYEQSDEDPLVEFSIDGLSAILALQDNKIDKAEKLLSKPYDLALIEPSVVYEHNRRLEELYARKNDFKNAYSYRLKTDAYDDSLRNTKVRNNIAEMEMRYRQDTTLLRKDLRIAAVEGRASQWQSIASMSLLALVLLALVVGIFIFYSRRKREHEYRRQVATVIGLRMEIVRNRISPHFMFNALNAIMPSLNRHKELEQSFGLLIQMLRNNLQASEKMAAPLEEEINLVKSYLQLQMMSNPEWITVDWQVADDVPADVLIPSMSIQIPVENAVKYAFTSDREDAHINIRIIRQTDAICIEIVDNGGGFHPGHGTFNERGTGSGLKMLRRTVDLFNTRNHRQMMFTIENRFSNGEGEQGTCVTMMIPLDYRFEML